MVRNLRRLIYLSGIYSIGSIFEKSLAFFFIPFYTTYLGTYDYGIVGLMSITVGLISTFIAPPLISGFVRYYYAPEYCNKKKLFLFNSLLFLAVQSFLLALLFYLLKDVISCVVLDNPRLVHIVKIYAFILFFQPVSEFLLTFIRQEEKAKFFIFVSWTGFLVTASSTLFGLLHLRIGVLALIYGNLIGLVYTVACVLPVFLKYSTPKISFSLLGPSLKFGYPLVFQGFSILLIQAGDRYVLKLFSTLSIVGLYSFSYKFAEIMNIILIVPLKQAIQPIVLKQEGKPEKLRAFVSSNCRYFYLLGMFLCLILALYSKEAIQIMARKEEYWRGWIIVPIIAFSYLQHGLGNFFNWGLTMSKKVYHISANVLISAIVNIGLNFVFIPLWGIVGAALATLLSYIVWNGLKIYYSAKFYNLHFDLWHLVLITIVGIGLYLLSLLIADSGSLSLNISIKFLILLAYPIIFYMTGFFNQKEKDYIHKLFVSLRTKGLRDTYAKIKSI